MNLNDIDLNYIKRETEKEYKLLDEVDDLW